MRGQSTLWRLCSLLFMFEGRRKLNENTKVVLALIRVNAPIYAIFFLEMLRFSQTPSLPPALNVPII